MKFEIDKKKYIESGLVDEKEHPTGKLLIYNYTPKCQFSRSWDEVTMMCRGLIVRKEDREIVARPFKKFFNYEEHVENGDAFPDEKPIVYPKFDGSLGILYWIDDEPYIATRGSFTSDQALWATNFIRRPEMFGYIKQLNKEYTHLFEIIYPENRIVVNYNYDGLVHLASIDTETGKSIAPSSGFPMPSSIEFTSYEELKAKNTPNEEGFVLHFPSSDFRCKIKFEDYVKLHKVMTGLSKIGVWEMLKEGKTMDDLIVDIPDEMHGWLVEVVKELQTKFSEIETEAVQASKEALQSVASDGDAKLYRKNVAEKLMKSKYPSIAFSVFDGKDYAALIWKMVRPKGLSTFRNDIDS